MGVALAQCPAILLAGNGRDRNRVRVTGEDIVRLDLERAIGFLEVAAEEREHVVDANMVPTRVVMSWDMPHDVGVEKLTYGIEIALLKRCIPALEEFGVRMIGHASSPPYT